MLNIFLCTGRTAVPENDDDFAFEAVTTSNAAGTPSRVKKGSLTMGKKKSVKLQIGAPTDFKHESHMGYEEIAGLDIAQYQEEMRMRIATMTQATSVISPSLTPQQQSQPQQSQPEYQRQRRPSQHQQYASEQASEHHRRRAPSSESATTASTEPSPPRRGTTVRRKPVPSFPVARSASTPYDEANGYTSSGVPTPEPSPGLVPRRSASASAANSTAVKKALVPLLGEARAGYGAGMDARTPGGPYVTHTAKIRWDGAMSEIEKALREG